MFDNALGVKLDDGSEAPVLPTDEQRNEALTRACLNIMLKCAIDQTYFIWIVGMKPNLQSLYDTKIWQKEINNTNDLKGAISASLPLLRSKMGVVSFIFSVLLTRSSHVIKDEMDDSTQPLVQEQFGHCSQEIVNLVLTGRAVTNVHDGDKVLAHDDSNNSNQNNNNNSNNNTNLHGADSEENAFVLKGIQPNQDIGFLSSLEVMRMAKVGDYYKTPKYPIWVVGSSSHYSILFGLNINTGKISSETKEEQDVARIFHSLDQTEQGMLGLDHLGHLLQLCGLNRINVNDAKFIIDRENYGMILKVPFVKNYKYLKAQDALKLKWMCHKCTFHNDFSSFRCNVCNDSYRNHNQSTLIIEDDDDAAAAQSQTQVINSNDANKNKNTNNNNNSNSNSNNSNELDNKPPEMMKQKSADIPKNFVLYHYNGLKTTKKDKPMLTKLMVYDDQEIDKIGSIAEELTALIRTKWEYAIVEHDGPFKPKIA